MFLLVHQSSFGIITVGGFIVLRNLISFLTGNQCWVVFLWKVLLGHCYF